MTPRIRKSIEEKEMENSRAKHNRSTSKKEDSFRDGSGLASPTFRISSNGSK